MRKARLIDTKVVNNGAGSEKMLYIQHMWNMNIYLSSNIILIVVRQPQFFLIAALFPLDSALLDTFPHGISDFYAIWRYPHLK